MSERKRITGPAGGTSAPLFSKLLSSTPEALEIPVRTTRIRPPNTLRKLFLKTGVTPSASGSSYLELASSTIPNSDFSLLSALSNEGLKVTCTVHGPRPMPRSVPFSPTISLSTHVRYAPFANKQRRSYMRDTNERDLAVHLESALRGVIIGDRWPKSSVEVIVTVLEGEDSFWQNEKEWKMHGSGTAGAGSLGMMSVLSGCITAASAAIIDAGIDCVDMVSGGVAALVQDRSDSCDGLQCSPPPEFVLDPAHFEHHDVLAACVVGYLPLRDEITGLWVRGELTETKAKSRPEKGLSYEELTDKAVQAALGVHRVITAAVKEAAQKRNE